MSNEGEQRWFQAKLYLKDQFIGTTVYYLPVDTPLQSGGQRKQILRPMEKDELFAFPVDLAPIKYRCDNPFQRQGWSIIHEDA